MKPKQTKTALPDNTPYNERELLQRIADGDVAAFNTLFNTYQQIIYSYALRLSRSQTLAQEIVQDTFLKVWLKKDSLSNISNARGWLFKVAGNVTYDALRKAAADNKKINHIHQHELDKLDKDAIFTTSEELLLQQEYHQLVNEAVKSLPERQQQAFTLVKLEGLTREQAAEKMGISSESVKTNVTIAMQKVRAHCIANMGSLGMLLFFWATR